MRATFLLMVAALTYMTSAFCQDSMITLTFSAENNGAYIQMDSIKVMNRTQGGSWMLHWPDTTLALEVTPGDLYLYVGYITALPVGVPEAMKENEQFQLFQNYPNPGKDQSLVAMYIPEKGMVNVTVSDVQGRVLTSTERQLDQGGHAFRFTPGSEQLYFLTARWNGISRSIKILVAEPVARQECMLEYSGPGKGDLSHGSPAISNNYVMQESGILDRPVANETYKFQFANNIPCIGEPIVVYEWQVYQTIQLFSQCWLRENLNIGEMVDSLQDQTDNGYVEKYCIGNSPDSCDKYGGLYLWWEIMNYNGQEGSKGICPWGWHIPTIEEAKVLDGAVDTQYGIGDAIWDEGWYRGYDAGTNLKTTTGWSWNGSGTNRFEYDALPGGRRVVDPNYSFYSHAASSFWWTSNINSTACGAWMHYLSYEEVGAGIGTSCDGFESGMSARCIKDY